MRDPVPVSTQRGNGRILHGCRVRAWEADLIGPGNWLPGPGAAGPDVTNEASRRRSWSGDGPRSNPIFELSLYAAKTGCWASLEGPPRSVLTGALRPFSPSAPLRTVSSSPPRPDPNLQPNDKKPRDDDREVPVTREVARKVEPFGPLEPRRNPPRRALGAGPPQTPPRTHLPALH